MNKTKRKLIAIAWTMFLLAVITAILAVTFFLTAYLYQITGLHVPSLLAQIVNTLVSLVLAGIMLGSVAHVARARGWLPEMNVFGPIIEALEKIAQGDFRVSLDDDFDDNPIVGELATRVNRMAVELNQMEALRQEFISNVSHEIQSPLTSIRGFARALQSDDLSREDRNHYLGIIETESTRLSKLSDNLLALASLEAENPRFEPKPYRLDKQIRRVILACEPQWTDKAIDMDVSLGEIEIAGDEDLLSQVWINLLHNSIKFTPHGGRVCLDLCRRDGGIVFTIADTGIGIAEDDLPRVFERFFKADTSRERARGGSGLGLSIAKKIVEMHHGTMSVESRLGTGTTFTVCLPAEA